MQVNDRRRVVLWTLAASLTGLLATESLGPWAGRDGRRGGWAGGVAGQDREMNARWFRMHPGQHAQERPDGLTPFGRGYKADPPGDARGLIATGAGYLDLKQPGKLLDRLPAEFKTQ